MHGNAFALSLTNKKQVRLELLKILGNIKFRSLLPKLAILGAPNVGKSTLLNIFAQGHKANAENRAGVTKQNS
jgi:ribosome biogenesis GTPase A